MKKTIILLFAVLFATLLFATSPEIPFYRFFDDAPTRTTIPFIQAQQEILAEKGVETIREKLIGSKDYTEYRLDGKGRVIWYKFYGDEDGGLQLLTKCDYSYNNQDQLTSRTCNYLLGESGDFALFTYDQNGRLASYQEAFIYESGKDTIWEFQLKLKEKTPTKTVLTDDEHEWVFDENNMVISRQSSWAKSKITTKKLSETEYLKEYWYTHADSLRLGGKQYFYNGRILTDTSYYIPNLNHKNRKLSVANANYYYYDEKDRLLAKKGKTSYHPHTFYIHDQFLKNIVHIEAPTTDKQRDRHYQISYYYKGHFEQVQKNEEVRAKNKASFAGLLWAGKVSEGLTKLEQKESRTWKDYETAAIIFYKIIYRHKLNKGKTLKTSIQLILKSIVLEENATNTATHARILFEQGKRKQAIEKINEALKMGEQEGIDLSDIKAAKRYYEGNKE